MSKNNHYLEAAVDKQKEVYRNLFVSFLGVMGVVHQVVILLVDFGQILCIVRVLA